MYVLRCPGMSMGYLRTCIYTYLHEYNYSSNNFVRRVLRIQQLNIHFDAITNDIEIRYALRILSVEIVTLCVIYFHNSGLSTYDLKTKIRLSLHSFICVHNKIHQRQTIYSHRDLMMRYYKPISFRNFIRRLTMVHVLARVGDGK